MSANTSPASQRDYFAETPEWLSHELRLALAERYQRDDERQQHEAYLRATYGGEETPSNDQMSANAES